MARSKTPAAGGRSFLQQVAFEGTGAVQPNSRHRSHWRRVPPPSPGFAPVAPRSLNGPVFSRSARRFLEQQSTEPPLGEPQQEPARQPQQQCRLSCCQHALRRSRQDHGPAGREHNERSGPFMMSTVGAASRGAPDTTAAPALGDARAPAGAAGLIARVRAPQRVIAGLDPAIHAALARARTRCDAPVAAGQYGCAPRNDGARHNSKMSERSAP